MRIDDRIALLAADIVELEAGSLNPRWRQDSGESFAEWERRDCTEAASRADAFGRMLETLRAFVHMHETYIGIQPGALSRAECLLLAWRRGGFNEWWGVNVEQACRERDARVRRRSRCSGS
jgi:hypothetical protein